MARQPSAPVVIEPGRGPAIVGMPPQGPPIIHLPGPGRHPFAGFLFSGMEDVGQSMRSNASGIGGLYVRGGGVWTSRWCALCHRGVASVEGHRTTRLFNLTFLLAPLLAPLLSGVEHSPTVLVPRHHGEALVRPDKPLSADKGVELYPT